MKKKILVGSFGHETNTFSVLRTNIEQMAPFGIMHGQEMLDTLRGTPDYTGGVIEAAEKRGYGLIGTISCGNAGPLITNECLDIVIGELIGEIRAHMGEFDGICLGLHGAGCAERCDDLEAYTLREVRKLVGDDMPITVTLDLHGNISDEMAELANGLFGIKEYPHIDCAEAGKRAADCLIDQIEGKVQVETAHIKLPLLLAPSLACTFHEPLLSIKNHVDRFRDERGLIDATFFHGFPYSDIDLLGCSVIVVAQKGRAVAAAKELANWVWSQRQKLVPDCPTAAEAVDAAIQCTERPVVINEASDNPGGGAPADGTHLLRELVARNYPKTIFGFLFDPETVEQAHRAGVGARIDVRVGGKTDNIHGAPLELKGALVCALGCGEYVTTSPTSSGIAGSIGRCARLRYQNVDVIVASIATQTLDDRPFLATGADFSQYNIVGLKSTNHFRAFFEKNAKRIFTADPPGIHTANFSLLTYKNMPRPMFPIDKDVDFSV